MKSLSKLQILELDSNKFTGSLPAVWGEVDAFPNLTSLYLDDNLLLGSVPSSWGNAGAFSQLETLSLGFNGLSGKHVGCHWDMPMCTCIARRTCLPFGDFY